MRSCIFVFVTRLPGPGRSDGIDGSQVRRLWLVGALRAYTLAMTRGQIDQLLSLPEADQVESAEALWTSLGVGAGPLPDWQREAVDQALDEVSEPSADLRDWDVVRKEIWPEK